MKSKSYALKPWWPHSSGNHLQPGAGATLPDRLALFHHHVARAARRLGVSVEIQDRVVATVDQILASNVRPDIGRQAQEWVVQHRTADPRVAPLGQYQPDPVGGAGRGAGEPETARRLAARRNELVPKAKIARNEQP